MRSPAVDPAHPVRSPAAASALLRPCSSRRAAPALLRHDPAANLELRLESDERGTGEYGRRSGAELVILAPAPGPKNSSRSPLLLARSCFFGRVWHGSGAERGRSWRRSCAKGARNICVHVHCIQERIDPGVSDEYHLCAVHSRAITSDLANANVSPPKDPTIAS